MNQILSLALGSSSPSGLSGGATPLPSPKLSFAELLITPLPAAAPPTMVRTGMPGLPTAVCQSGEQVSLPKLVSDMSDTTPPLAGKVLAHNTAARALPMAHPIENATFASSPIGKNTTGRSSVLNAGLAAAEGPVKTSKQVVGLNEAALPVEPIELNGVEPVSLVEHTKPAEQGETPKTLVDTAQRWVEQEGEDNYDDGGTVGPLADPSSGEPEVLTTITDAPEFRQDIVEMDRLATPSPALVGNQVETTEDGIPPQDIARTDERILRTTRGHSEASEVSSLRSGSAPITVDGANDFTKVFNTDVTEAPATSNENGSGTSEILTQTRSDSAKQALGSGAQAASGPQPVSARPGEIGHQLGVEIVRHGLDGRDSLTIRLDPVEMGEIQIRLQFDDRGTMRAHVTAESVVALEMLRRDSADLVRALGDAGVRTDAQSFQFEGRGQGEEGQQGQHGRRQTLSDPHAALVETDEDVASPPQRLSASGQLDIIA
ncbi:MAG: hypothetical protein CL574_00165 [Altererythrobacter sp.]|nr:hypothetical protein [Altererythrobacter sp.]